MTTAIELADLDARSSLIQALTGLGGREAKEIFRDRNNTQLIQGKLPTSPKSILKTELTKIHAAGLIARYLAFRALEPKGDVDPMGRGHVAAFIDTYRWYSQQFSTTPEKINIEQFDALLKHFLLDKAALRKCEACDSVVYCLDSQKNTCPCCRSLKAIGFSRTRRSERLAPLANPLTSGRRRTA
jgi:hypothetical protein